MAVPSCLWMLTLYQVPLIPEPRVQSEGPENDQEEGESMDAVDQDDEAMMAAMGIAGFGTTKVRGPPNECTPVSKHVL